MTPIDRPSPHAPGRHGGDADTHHYTAAELHNEDVAHEHSDFNLRLILLSGVGIVVLMGISAVAMWVLFNVLDRQAAVNDPPLSPLALPAGQLPPVPRLLTNEPATLEKFREMEAKALETYGWVDQASGVAHIPIDEAKKKLLDRGLPAKADGADEFMGTNAPAMGESSGGRTIRVPKRVKAPVPVSEPLR